MKLFSSYITVAVFSLLLKYEDNMATSNKTSFTEATCIIHKYKGSINNSLITFTITSADYYNIFSMKGSARGYYQYKGQTCSADGEFKANENGVFEISFSSTEDKCPVSFSGEIACHSTSSTFTGLMISPGKMSPNYDDIELKSNN